MLNYEWKNYQNSKFVLYMRVLRASSAPFLLISFNLSYFPSNSLNCRAKCKRTCPPLPPFPEGPSLPHRHLHPLHNQDQSCSKCSTEGFAYHPFQHRPTGRHHYPTPRLLQVLEPPHEINTGTASLHHPQERPPTSLTRLRDMVAIANKHSLLAVLSRSHLFPQHRRRCGTS